MRIAGTVRRQFIIAGESRKKGFAPVWRHRAWDLRLHVLRSSQNENILERSWAAAPTEVSQVFCLHPPRLA